MIVLQGGGEAGVKSVVSYNKTSPSRMPPFTRMAIADRAITSLGAQLPVENAVIPRLLDSGCHGFRSRFLRSTTKPSSVVLSLTRHRTLSLEHNHACMRTLLCPRSLAKPFNWLQPAQLVYRRRSDDSTAENFVR